MSAKIYLEGGGDSKELHIRCREGFRRLLEGSGFAGRMPRLIACGSRAAAFDDFKTAHQNNSNKFYVALLVDSEELVQDIEKTWMHLMARDNWAKPAGANDDQVLLMTTCMETWVVSDRPALRKHYGPKFKEQELPHLSGMEIRERHDVQAALEKATGGCKNAYQKGKRSFEIVGLLSPTELRKHLPSFDRLERILKTKL